MTERPSGTATSDSLPALVKAAVASYYSAEHFDIERLAMTIFDATEDDGLDEHSWQSLSEAQREKKRVVARAVMAHIFP